MAAHLELLCEAEPDGVGETVREAISDDSSTSPSGHDDAEKDQNGVPETPKAPMIKRLRRQRNWVWTLGPIAKETVQQKDDDRPIESVVRGDDGLAT